MAILKKEEYLEKLHNRLGEDTSDEAISFLEDMTDTYNDLENKAKGDGVDWEQKYKDLDESWKKRYRHRFFSGEAGMPEGKSDPVPDNEYKADDIVVEDLFTKKEKK